MAVCALRSLAALVNVIRRMAGNALLGRSLVTLACVARGAGNFAMLVGQLEVGLLVIKGIFLPGLRVVALRAFGAEVAAVYVVLAVTVDAGGGRLPIRRLGFVASRAGHRHVRVLQREIRQVVGEASLVELVDVSVAAEVLVMATAALAGGRLGHPSMVTGFCVDIGGSGFVAIEAQCRLPLTVGTVMAIAAFAFDLGVGLGDRPR